MSSNPVSESVPAGHSTTGLSSSGPGQGGSASRNSAAAVGQGEFASKRERDAPLSTGGVSQSDAFVLPICTVPLTEHLQHQPGVLVGNDAAPEFHAQVLPAGSAPADKTFKPNPVNETPQDGSTSAADTLGGATSGDVHTGLGHPGQGQTSKDLHSGGATKSQGSGGTEGLKTTAERNAVGGSDADVSERQTASATEREPEKST